MAPMQNGTVYLVGAGPGALELLTLRAAQLIREAEVIVHDHLVSTEILAQSRPEAERIYAGKERGAHTLRQEEINRLLVKLARSHKKVLRLKGGDPYTFGRGGEEALALFAHHIPFEVVPGITAATAVAAYAGIPLTHRAYAQSVVFATGHLKDGSIDLHWQSLARREQTVVIYMGLLGLSHLCAKLIEHGLSADWPAAIVEHGTYTHQRTIVGTLTSLPQRAAAAQISAPTLIIIGEVVQLQNQLRWFENASLYH